MITIKARNNRTQRIYTIEVYSTFIFIKELGERFDIAVLDEFAIMKKKAKYAEPRLQAAYENACDCLYHRYDKRFWNNYDLPDDIANGIWNDARRTIAAGERY